MSQSNNQGSGNAYLVFGAVIVICISVIISFDSIGVLGAVAAIGGLAMGISAVGCIQGKHDNK
jgi:hypothetical protein